MIKVSDHAKEKAIQLMTEDGFQPFEDFIRVGVKSGGCSGLEYVLKFDKEKTDADQIKHHRTDSPTEIDDRAKHVGISHRIHE